MTDGPSELGETSNEFAPKELPVVHLFTDGSTYPGNPGVGGWGAVIFSQEKIRTLSGWVPQATNNYMETMAVLGALKVLKGFCEVHIYTDSAYVVAGLRAMKDGKRLKTNTELWNRIHPYWARHAVATYKVSGHADQVLNIWADKLASAAAKNQINEDVYADRVPEAYQKAAERKHYRCPTKIKRVS